MGNINCVRGEGSTVAYIVCDLMGKYKGYHVGENWLIEKPMLISPFLSNIVYFFVSSDANDNNHHG